MLKSHVLRIGKGHTRKVNRLVINGSPVEFVAQMKYLGWYILSGNAFRVSLHYMRVRFYQCFNSLFAVISVNQCFSILLIHVASHICYMDVKS